jgi:hypothetical protein
VSIMTARKTTTRGEKKSRMRAAPRNESFR